MCNRVKWYTPDVSEKMNRYKCCLNKRRSFKILAIWKNIELNPWREEPGRLQSLVLLRVRDDWATSLSLFTFMHWRRKWQPTPVFLPGESQGWGEPGGLPSMGSHRVEHDWSDLAAVAATKGWKTYHVDVLCPFNHKYIKLLIHHTLWCTYSVPRIVLGTRVTQSSRERW